MHGVFSLRTYLWRLFFHGPPDFIPRDDRLSLVSHLFNTITAELFSRALLLHLSVSALVSVRRPTVRHLIEPCAIPAKNSFRSGLDEKRQTDDTQPASAPHDYQPLHAASARRRSAAPPVRHGSLRRTVGRKIRRSRGAYRAPRHAAMPSHFFGRALSRGPCLNSFLTGNYS